MKSNTIPGGYRIKSLFRFEEILDSSYAAHEVCGLVWQINSLGLVASGNLFKHLDVFLCEQIVGRIGALAHGLCNLLDGYSFSFSLAYLCLCLTFCIEDCHLFVGLGPVYYCCLLTL